MNGKTNMFEGYTPLKKMLVFNGCLADTGFRQI